MTPPGTGVAGPATPGATAVAEVPALAEGVQLLGTLDASGFKEPPCLARRADGQTIQLTELLYRVLEAIDGRRDTAAIADHVSGRIGKRASPDDVGYLVDEKLRPLGLLKQPDGSEPEVRKANPLLALRFRWVLADEATTRRVTAPFARLFHLPIVVAVVVGFFAMVGWLLFSEGVGASTREVLYRPGFLVLVFVLAAASAGFHEFGHAAALRFGGGTPGVMGAGLYLVWPAFYTDVTDSYRLPRRARLRTDLGGLYFNMVFALGVFGVWAATGADALLLVVPILLLQMVQQLLPFVRLDGYHILADLTGVPDLFARIRPTLASVKPGSHADERVTALKPWVRVVVTAWVVAVVPLLLASLAFAVFSFPRAAATAWDSFGLQRQAFSGAWSGGDALGAAAAALAVVALTLPVLSTVYLVGRLANRGSRATR
jgi:putative peptide zinc metalloprotease protein